MAEAGPEPIRPLSGTTTSVYPTFSVASVERAIGYRMILSDRDGTIATPTLNPQSRSWKCTIRLKPNHDYTWTPQCWVTDHWQGGTGVSFTTDAGTVDLTTWSIHEQVDVDGRKRISKSKITQSRPITYEEA